MKQASGYITEDGSFFESEEEARLHEAESRLRGAIALAAPNADIDGVLTVVHLIKGELGEYLNAFNAEDKARADRAEVENRAEANESGEAEMLGHIGHVSSAEEDLASLLKLPTRGPSNVSNVGGGPRTEKVQERREEHGSGVRGADASGVRRSTDMAAEPGSAARHARPDSRKKDIQKRKVERDME